MPNQISDQAIERLSSGDIRDFILRHAEDDVRALGLARMPPEWPRPQILDQIHARQKARDKMPAWYATESIVFPSADLMEQCSSQATAAFKAGLVDGESFADLTAGAGIDTAAIAARFSKGYAVERDAHAASCLTHNLPLMGVRYVDVLNKTCEDFIAGMPPVDLVFLDPQRRNTAQRGLFRLEDTSPNILDLLPDLNTKAKSIMLKTSPVLDIDLGVTQLPSVRDVHVVEWNGECKEILFIIQPGYEGQPAIHAHRLKDDGLAQVSLTATRAEDDTTPCPIAQPEGFLYEPGPAFMKAGLFNTMAARYGLKKLHPSTHLYTSDVPVKNFPGRGFRIESVVTIDRRSIPDKANLAIRNFPGTVDELKKKLGVRDGGDIYLFACTLADGQKRIIVCQKL